jgi:Mn2+/Fe2+ NRAMP family transporter
MGKLLWPPPRGLLRPRIIHVDPIKALVWSAIVNSVISVPIMAAMMLVGQSEKLIGQYTISARYRFFSWSATLVMAVAVLVIVATSF